jgi:hypothetical protein
MQNIKTTLFLCLTKSAPCHEGLWDMDINIHSCIILDFRWRWVISFMPWYWPKKEWSPLDTRRGGSQNRYRRGREENILLSSGIEPRFPIRPACSLVTILISFFRRLQSLRRLLLLLLLFSSYSSYPSFIFVSYYSYHHPLLPALKYLATSQPNVSIFLLYRRIRVLCAEKSLLLHNPLKWVNNSPNHRFFHIISDDLAACICSYL